MIPVEKIPNLQALWERADAAFLADDGYIVAMAEAAGKIYAKRQAQREKEDGAPPADSERQGAQEAVYQARDKPLERCQGYGVASVHAVPSIDSTRRAGCGDVGSDHAESPHG